MSIFSIMVRKVSPASAVADMGITARALDEHAPAGPQEIAATKQRKPSVHGPRELPATLAECRIMEEELVRDSIRLECSLGIAEGKARNEKVYADPDWYHRAKAALKHINRDRQRLQVHMKDLRIAERNADPAWNTRDKALLRELQRVIGMEQFDCCAQKVEERISAQAGGQ